MPVYIQRPITLHPNRLLTVLLNDLRKINQINKNRFLAVKKKLLMDAPPAPV